MHQEQSQSLLSVLSRLLVVLTLQNVGFSEYPVCVPKNCILNHQESLQNKIVIFTAAKVSCLCVIWKGDIPQISIQSPKGRERVALEE